MNLLNYKILKKSKLRELEDELKNERDSRHKVNKTHDLIIRKIFQKIFFPLKV